ncbi:MAG: hypothetical protein COA58_06370 [Bacteroidetes bacterium]|nr:MAG: hypothetical protein COA58_06370 [Bacteroidota bacterium]
MIKGCNQEKLEFVLGQLVIFRDLTLIELKIFRVMISINEHNYPLLSDQEIIEKHQSALDYVLNSRN